MAAAAAAVGMPVAVADDAAAAAAAAHLQARALKPHGSRLRQRRAALLQLIKDDPLLLKGAILKRDIPFGFYL